MRDPSVGRLAAYHESPWEQTDQQYAKSVASQDYRSVNTMAALTVHERPHRDYRWFLLLRILASHRLSYRTVLEDSPVELMDVAGGYTKEG
ncbi:MAG TPA: hypothetical protein VFS39_02410 [Nitrospira sp.]|nr:hypothetical protein [Nitrospira sp.]